MLLLIYLIHCLLRVAGHQQQCCYDTLSQLLPFNSGGGYTSKLDAIFHPAHHLLIDVWPYCCHSTPVAVTPASSMLSSIQLTTYSLMCGPTSCVPSSPPTRQSTTNYDRRTTVSATGCHFKVGRMRGVLVHGVCEVLKLIAPKRSNAAKAMTFGVHKACIVYLVKSMNKYTLPN